ncbi:MAG: hypothetical protein K0U12_01985 [Gammaproteobacteria bacterium]|nr:hypothetical protein [Gammaproteobacteria bacterium]
MVSIKIQDSGLCIVWWFFIVVPAVIIVSYLDLALYWRLSIVGLMVVYLIWLKIKNSLVKITAFTCLNPENNRWQLEINHQLINANLLGSSICLQKFMLLHWQADNRRYQLCIWPDSISAEEFWRLRAVLLGLSSWSG